MEYIRALFSIITEPWVAPTSFFFALALLETERRWVRARRQRGFRYSPLPHLLDALIALLSLVVLISIRRAIVVSNMERILIAAVPLAWAIGLILILVVGFNMIQQIGANGSARKE